MAEQANITRASFMRMTSELSKPIEFAVSQMRLQLTKSVIFAGVCCFVSQLSTFRSEHYLLFSCKEKVNIWGKRKIFP